MNKKLWPLLGQFYPMFVLNVLNEHGFHFLSIGPNHLWQTYRARRDLSINTKIRSKLTCKFKLT